MNIRLYLDEKRFSEEGKILTMLQDKNWNLYRGIRILQDGANGIHYAEIPSIVDKVPEELFEFMGYFTLYEMIYNSPKRESGLYEHNGSEANLQVLGQKDCYELRIRANTFEDLKTLYLGIKDGTMKPKHSYESPANREVFIKDLKTALDDTQQKLWSEERKYAESQSMIRYLKKALVSMVEALNGGRWSIITKKRAIQMIQKILDDTELIG